MGKQKKFHAILTIWLAVAALLMMSLAPSISRALPRQQHAADLLQFEICSVHQQEDGNSDSSDPVDGHRASVPCPYCLVQGDLIGPSHHATLAGTVFFVAFHLATPSFFSAPSRFAWTVAPSRAPPVTA